MHTQFWCDKLTERGCMQDIRIHWMILKKYNSGGEREEERLLDSFAQGKDDF